MPLVEQWFEADSDMCVAALEAGLSGEERWLLTLCLMRTTVDAWGWPAATQQQILKAARNGYFAEMHGGKRLQSSLSSKYRAHAASIERWLSGEWPSGAAATKAAAVRFDERVRALAVALRTRVPERLHADVARALLHMQVNRMMSEAGRAQELVLIDFLMRWVGQVAARGHHPVVKV